MDGDCGETEKDVCYYENSDTSSRTVGDPYHPHFHVMRPRTSSETGDAPGETVWTF